MPPLGKADGPLVVAVDNRLRQPHAGKRSAFGSYRQRPVRDKAAEPGDILRGLAPPRHAVHDRPTTGDRILEGAKDEPVRVDRLGVDADLDQVVYQGVNGGAKRDHLGGVRRDRLAAAGLSP